MDLFNEYRKSYITVCFATAVIYAFVLGGNQPILFRVADGLIYGSILCLIGFILWNIFRFAIPVNLTPVYLLIFLSVFAILTSLFAVGIELFTIYLCFPDSFGFFTHTIPARLFITLLIFVIIRLFYISCHEKIKTRSIPTTHPETMKPSDTVMPLSIEPTVLADRITVRSGQKIKIIPINDIIYIKADGDYISINTSEGSWLKEQTMKHTEDTLPTNHFVRIHRSYIVNISQISRIERYGEKQQVVLHNNEKIKISTARYQALRQVLGF
ncbi:MAG: LytTR family transcriptional regulator DNA-binding domain-containing protein [Tannerella sp.]|jgi:hypothetical protein|nr:LytTR family transcriptional regulator DNA-binding domain-containing protein [Tannerella sp.]